MKYKFVEDKPKTVKQCLHCGKSFTDARGGKKYCSEDCRLEAYKVERKHIRDRYNQLRREKLAVMTPPEKISDTDREVILALAEHDLNETQVSRVLFMCRKNVDYHEDRIKQITGLNPRRFYDLCKLVQMVRENDDHVQI